MTEETVIVEGAPVNDGATEKTPVFNSLEELEKYEASRQPVATEEIKEPVKSEEVAKQETIIDKAEQPQFDVVSFLKGSFGDEYDDIEKVKTALTKTADVPEELKPFIEDAKFLSENPQLREWNKLAAKGTDIALAYEVTKMDVTKLTPKDALVIDLIFNDKLTKEEANAIVELNHKDAFGSEDDYDANEKLAANAALKMQAEKAKERLVKFQQEIRLPEPERRAAAEKVTAEQNEAKRKESWKPEVKKIADSFTVALNGEYGADTDKTAVEFTHSLDEKGKKEFSQIVESIVSNPNYEVTKENVQSVRNLAEAIYFAQHRETIMHQYAQKVIEKRDEAWGAKVYGIPPKNGTPPDNFQTGKVVVKETREDSGFGRW